MRTLVGYNASMRHTGQMGGKWLKSIEYSLKLKYCVEQLPVRDVCSTHCVLHMLAKLNLIINFRLLRKF